ncbi:MAG: flippase-like domain-containing protein [Acidobacteria bacterium]|nr:flippase-like domain-containing protein [Acidobacteriota bacterium]MCA1608194.1 flippase-like domain-containing protein [Acidobacteriota bacterium]
MNTEHEAHIPQIETSRFDARHATRIKIIGAILTIGGVALFSYFVYSVGVSEILNFIDKFGVAGFAVILGVHLLRIGLRAGAWTLSVHEPYILRLREAVSAVIIGEALSSMIPLGILVSGTAKAVAVRQRLPLVVGLSSVATENLFYSITTSIFLIFGAYTFARGFELERGWVITIDILIGLIFLVILLIVAMIVRHWHFASEICERMYRRGWLTGILEHGRMQVRLFENFIYGFYRKYPRRFLPIFLLEATYHALGVFETWFILTMIAEAIPSVVSAFLLESVSRLITIVFKLVPFLVGVDEAGARFVGETLAIGAGMGVSLAIIRKGRILFWTAVGLLLLIKRGLTFRDIAEVKGD